MLEKFREGAFWQFLLIFASGFVIVALIFDYLFATSEPELIYALRIGDLFACLIFALDFAFKLFEPKLGKKFWRLAWIDILASVPNLAALGVGYFAWFFYLCNLIRIARAGFRLVSRIFFDKERALMSIASSLLFASILISSLLILNLEAHLPSSNIKSLEDALWWAISTVTTVGYGDLYPVSLNGRIVGVFLMFVGISLFSMLSALVLSWLLTSIVHNEDDSSREDVSKTVKEIKELINKKLP